MPASKSTIKIGKSQPSTLRESLFSFLLSFLVSLFLLRGIFLNPGQIGHNWDFTFPAFISEPNNINFLSLFTWNSSNFGYQQHLTGAHLVPNLIYTGLVTLFGVEIGSKLLLLFIVTISLLTFQVFSKQLFKKISTIDHFLLSIIYGISPFAFNEIVGGSWYMWLSYAAAPMYLFFAIKYFEEEQKKSLVGLIASSIFVIPSMQNFVLIHGFLLVYLFISYRQKENFWQKIISWHSMLLIINFYWIWLTIRNLTHLSGEFTSGQFTSNFDQVRYSSQPFHKIFDLTGYLNRHFYYQALPHKIATVFSQLMYLVWGLGVLIYLNFFANKKSKVFILFLMLFFFVVKGGLAPFSYLTMFLFENIPLSSLYRSPQHLMILPQFVFVVLFGYLLTYLSSKTAFILSRLTVVVFIIIYTSGWWYYGDLGHTKMKVNGRDYIDFYALDQGLKLAYDLAEENQTGIRHLVLPAVQSPLYEQVIHHRQAQGGISEYMYLSTPTFSAENTTLGKKVEQAVCSGDLSSLESLIKASSIGFVTLRNDISPAFTDCAKNWDWQSAKKLLDNSADLKLLFSTEHTFSYLVSSPESIISSQNSDDLLQVKKINPTKYTFVLPVTSSVKTIIHNENFSQHWQLQDESGKILTRSTNLNGKNSYHQDNGFAPGKEYQIVFSLQRNYELFIFISFTCFLVFSILTLKKK